MAVSNMNSRGASGNVTVFQYGITGLSESTALIQSKARALHESGELLNMVQDLNDSAVEDYVGKTRYLEDRSKISDVDYTLGQDGWYYRLNPKGDAWIKVRYGENPAIDEIYRSGWRRSGAFCMSWPALTKNKGIPDRLDVSITGDMSAYERFLDVVEREPRPCEVRIGGIESTNFPDKFVKLDCLRFEGVNAIRPDFKVQNGDRINIKFRPRYPKPNLTPEGTTFDTTIKNTAPNPNGVKPFTVTVENIGGWKENTNGIVVWNTTNQTYGGYRAFESYSNTGVASSTAEMIIKVVNNTRASRTFYFWLAPRCQSSADYTYYQYGTNGTSWTGSATSSTYHNNNASWQQKSCAISAGGTMWFKFVYVKNASTDTAPDKGGVFIQDTYNNDEVRSIYNPSNADNMLGLNTFHEQDSFTYEDVTDTEVGATSTHREYSVSYYADPMPAIGCLKYGTLSAVSTGSYTWNGFDGIFTAKSGLDSGKIYYASVWIKKYQESNGYCVISVINPADNSVVAVKAWKAGPEWRRVWIGFTGLSSVIINYSHRSYSGIYEPNSAAGTTVSAAYGYWNPSEAAPGDDVLICGIALQEADDVDPMTCPGWDDLDTATAAASKFIMPLFAPQLGNVAYSNNLEDMPPTFYKVGNEEADKTALLFKLRSGSTDTFDMYWKTTRLTSSWDIDVTNYVYNGTAVMKNGWLYAGIYLGSSASDYDCLHDLNTNTIYPIENTAVTSSYRGYYYNTFSSSNSYQASTGTFMFGSGYGGGASSDSYFRHNIPVDIAYVSVTRNGREIRRWMPARWNISDVGVAAQNYGCQVDDSGYCITAAGARASRHHKSEGMWEYVRNTFEDVNFSRTTVYVTSGDSSHPTGTFFTPRTEDPAATDTKEAVTEKYARHIVDVNDNANFHWLWRNNLGWVDPDTVDSVSMAWAYVDSSMGELKSGLTWSDSLPGSRTTTGFSTSKPGTGTSSSFYLYRPTVTWKSGTPLVTTEDPGVLCQVDYFDFPLEWACVSNSAYIDTGITVSSRHRIKIKFQCSASANVQASVTGSLIQCMYPGHRAVMHIDMTAGAAGWWAYEGLPAFRIGYYKFGGLHSPLNLEFGNGYVKDLDTARYMTVDYRDDGVANSMVSTYGFSSLTMSTAKTAHIEPTAEWSSSEYTWTIGKGFNTAGTNGGMIRIWYVIIEDEDGTVLADLRPHFHMGTMKVYFIDMVSGRRIQGMSITKFADDDNDTAAQASARKLVPSHSRVTRYFWETYSTSSACGVTGPSSARSAISPFSTCHWFEWLQMVALPNMYIGGYENKETDRNEIWIHPGAYAGEKCPPGMIPLFANEDDSGEIVSAGKFKLVSRYKATGAHYTTADWDPSIFPNLDTTRGREWLRRGVTSASGLTPYNVAFNNANNTGMCGSDYALQNSHVYGLTSWEHMGLGFIESAYLQTMYVYLERPGFTYQDARFNSTALAQRRPTGLSDAYATRPGVTGRSGKAYPFGTGMGQGPKIERISNYSPSERSYWNISDKFGYNREFAFMWIENFGSDKGVFTVGDYYVNNYMQPNDSAANTYDPDTSIPIIKGRYGTQIESGHDIPYYTGYTGGNTFNSPWQGYGFYNTNGVTAKLRIYSNPDGTPTGVSKSDANPSRKSMRCERFLTFSANKASQLTFENQSASRTWVPDIFKNGTYDRVLPYDTQIYYAGSNSYNLWMGVNIWGACTNSGGWNTIQGLTAFKNMTIDGKFDPIFAYTGFGVNYYPGNFAGSVFEWRYVGYGSWAAYNSHAMGVYSSNPYILFANYYNSNATGSTYMVTCDVTGI